MKKFIVIAIVTVCGSSGCAWLGLNNQPSQFIEPERMFAISEYRSKSDRANDVIPVSFVQIEEEIGDPFLAFEMSAR